MSGARGFEKSFDRPGRIGCSSSCTGGPHTSVIRSHGLLATHEYSTYRAPENAATLYGPAAGGHPSEYPLVDRRQAARLRGRRRPARSPQACSVAGDSYFLRGHQDRRSSRPAQGTLPPLYTKLSTTMSRHPAKSLHAGASLLHPSRSHSRARIWTDTVALAVHSIERGARASFCNWLNRTMAGPLKAQLDSARKQQPDAGGPEAPHERRRGAGGASPQLLPATLDALTAHIAILDDVGCILAVNEAWRRFADENGFGGQDAGVGTNYLTIGERAAGPCAEHADEASRGIRDVLAGRRQLFELEYPCHGPATPRWFMMRVTAFRTTDGVRGVVAHEDITERKRMQDALARSDERYRLVARATNDVIWDWDLLTGRVEWNDAIESALLYPRDRVGATAGWRQEQIHPADREWVTAALRSAIDRGEQVWAAEYRFRRGDDRYVTVQDRAYVARDESGEAVHVVGSMSDLTERKHAESSLQLLADLSRELGGLTDELLIIACAARMMVASMADVCAMEVDGDDVEDAGPTAPLRVVEASAALMGEPVDRMMDSKSQSCLTVPLIARERPIGTMMLVAAVPTKRSDGEDVGGRRGRPYTAADLRLADDVARRVALAVDNARLLREARAASSVAQAATKDAEDANRAKSDFLATISHELRTPLNAVLGYSDLLLGGVPSTLEAPAKAQVERIYTASRHLLQLIEEILSFSRLEAGKESVQLAVLDAAGLIEDIDAIVEPLARSKGLTYSTSIEVAVARPIASDPAKLRQIAVNLLANAIKFTEKSGEIRLTFRADAKELTIEVADSGIGIGVQHLEHIFSPFWQVDQRATRPVGGTGLGLTVTRRLARLLGGDVTVRSELGVGSVFTVRLPTRTVID